MGFSSKLAKTISSLASFSFFLVIFLQIPLFRVPCRCGICKSPVQVTSSHLTAVEILPVNIATALSFPGMLSTNFDNIFSATSNSNCYLNNVKPARLATTDIRYLEILVGSYLCVAGAMTGLVKRGRLSLFGMLLLLWGLLKELLLLLPRRHGRHGDAGGAIVQMYPTFFFAALIISFLCVKGDVRIILRTFRFRTHNKKPKFR